MAHIEDIGDLEGKKSLFEDRLVFFKGKRPFIFHGVGGGAGGI